MKSRIIAGAVAGVLVLALAGASGASAGPDVTIDSGGVVCDAATQTCSTPTPTPKRKPKKTPTATPTRKPWDPSQGYHILAPPVMTLAPAPQPHCNGCNYQ